MPQFRLSLCSRFGTPPSTEFGFIASLVYDGKRSEHYHPPKNNAADERNLKKLVGGIYIRTLADIAICLLISLVGGIVFWGMVMLRTLAIVHKGNNEPNSVLGGVPHREQRLSLNCGTK